MTKPSAVAGWIVAAFILCAQSPAFGGDDFLDFQAIASPFSKGSSDFTFTSAYTHPVRGDRHKLFTEIIGLDYAVCDRITLGVEGSGVYLDGSEPQGAGGGFGFRGRAQLFELGKLCVVFDAGVGFIEADHNLPNEGTHFNFTESFGFEGLLPLSDRFFLMGGARAQHISNADLGEHNPGYDGVQFFLGFVARF